jgi:tetratricopeptide (TPR) repeat protein
VTAASLVPEHAQTEQTPRPDHSQADALAHQAYDAAFNLDYDAAVAAARRLTAVAPDEPRSHRVLATVLWTRILFQIGAITVDHFMGSLTKSKDTRPPVPADLHAEFTRALDRAIGLAETRLDRNRRDLEARYDAGAAYAIQASFRASIDGSVTAAFGPARKAYSAQADVLEHDPDHPSANVIAGAYRYVVSQLRFPSRWFAYLVGFAGDGERGIAMIEGATRDPDALYDALPALLLIYTRERRHDQALAVAERLARAFPRNRLFRLEVASATLRAGRARQAERLLAAGVGELGTETRPLAPGERAMWLYQHAAALVELGRAADAQRRLDEALAREPLGWVRGRIHLERGKLADLAGRRSDALEAYRLARAIAERDNDPIGQRAAQGLLDRPFRHGDRR